MYCMLLAALLTSLAVVRSVFRVCSLLNMNVVASSPCRAPCSARGARSLVSPVFGRPPSKYVQLPACRSLNRSAQRAKYTVQASSADTEVQTGNVYKFTNSVSENTFEVKGDINKVFRYAADFSHIDKWDSGMYCLTCLTTFMFSVVVSSLYTRAAGTTDSNLRESDSRPAFKVGDTVALMTVLLGVKSSCV